MSSQWSLSLSPVGLGLDRGLCGRYIRPEREKERETERLREGERDRQGETEREKPHKVVHT